MTDGAHIKEVACSLTDEEFRERRAFFRNSILSEVLNTSRTDSGIRMIFPGTKEVLAEVEMFVDLERQCCGFLTFEIETEGEGLALCVEGPPNAQETLDSLAQAVSKP